MWSVQTSSETQKPPLIFNPKIKQYNEIPFATVNEDYLWNQDKIDVCWENPTNADAPMREMVRIAVKNTWQHYSNIQFEGWEKCKEYSDDSKGIRILISDERPHTKGLGNSLNGRPEGMVLNFSFEIWGERCDDKFFCMKVLAIHEFGHALGFAHEHNRDDAPPECEKELEDPSLEGNWNLTSYDNSSVMNYCNSDWLGNGVLSKRDISAVEYIYKNRVARR